MLTIRAALLCLLASASACEGKARDPRGEPPPEAMTVPPPPPREYKMVEPSGAILTKPEPEWQWLEGDAVKAHDPDAVLGLLRDEECRGYVTVVPKVESSPRDAANRILAERKAQGIWDVHVDEDVLYAGHTARRWELQRELPGRETKVSIRASFLVEGPRLYGLYAIGTHEDYGRRRRCLDQVTAAFDVRMWEPPEGTEPDAAP